MTRFDTEAKAIEFGYGLLSKAFSRQGKLILVEGFNSILNLSERVDFFKLLFIQMAAKCLITFVHC